MSKALTMLGLLVLLPAGVAMGGDDCLVPMADWQPRDAVARLAEESGWAVRRIRIEDGCYEIDGTDAEGHRIEVKLDPGSLDPVEMRIRYREGGAEHAHGHGSGRPD